jgi:hypothetical protein
MFRALITAALFALLIPGGLYPQGLNGSLTGWISDPAGGVIPGARVTVTHAATGVVSQTTTNASGVYTFASLPIGVYELRVEATGFKTRETKGLVLETGQTLRADVILQIGDTRESVTVTAEAPLLDRETSSIGTQVSSEMVNALPYQLTTTVRNPFDFVRLTPGVTGDSVAGNGVKMTGGRAYASEVMVDGAPLSYNPTVNIAGPAIPSVDSVAEFHVESVLPPAEYGRTSSGVVLVATHSGANEPHGTLFLYLQNNALDARRYNAVSADILRQGEFGVSFGGPLVIPKFYSGRNRTFFFFNYTGFRRGNDILGQVTTVPTASERSGDFSKVAQVLYDPQTAAGSAPRQPFAGNVIPQNRISPLAAALNRYFPLPNGAGVSSNYTAPKRASTDGNMYFGKIDHNFSDRYRMSASYRPNTRDATGSNGLMDPISDQFFQLVSTYTSVVSTDMILRPNLLNRVEAAFTRATSGLTASQDVGLAVPGAFAGGFPGVRFSGQGFASIGYGNNGDQHFNNYSLQESLAWNRGRHNMKFGVRYDALESNPNTPGFLAGAYTFSQFGTSQPQVSGTGNSYASFLLGSVSSATMALNTPTGSRSKYYAVFAQDDWKILNRLTLNYGLRYEVQQPFSEVAGRVSTMDANMPNPGAGGRLGAIVFGGAGAGHTGANSFMQTYYGGIGPRLGLAWQLGTRTVLRAGAGLFYAPLVPAALSQQGYSSNISIASQDGGLTPVFAFDRGWAPGSAKLPPFIDPTVANGQATSTTQNRAGGSGRLPRTSQWQFGLQQTVRGMLVEASYVGTVAHGIDNSTMLNINQVNPGYLALGSLLTRNISDPTVRAAGYGLPYAGFNGTLAQALRAFPQYQGINTLDAPTGNSTYHALLVKAEKRLSHGLQLLASYAVSKALSDVSLEETGYAGPQDQFNLRAEKALASTDIPQTLVLSYTYELPFGAGKPFLGHGVGKQLLGGWSVSGIHTYSGGLPLHITTPNGLPIFGGQLRPDRVNGTPVSQGPGRADFVPLDVLSGNLGNALLNRQAFAVPAPFTLGTLGPYLPDLRGFGVRGEDFSLFRRFRAGERARIEFRSDFFNAFNHRNLNAPITDLSDPNFGRITGQGAARVIQLGFRATF